MQSEMSASKFTPCLWTPCLGSSPLSCYYLEFDILCGQPSSTHSVNYPTTVPGTKMLGFQPVTPYVDKNASSNEHLFNIKQQRDNLV